MNMRIYTYFDSIPELSIEENLRLVNLWRRHHAALGFQPVVLNEWHALCPNFKRLNDAFAKLPSINPGAYDRACYLRWLAMANIGGGIMMDYDTFIYATPAQFTDWVLKNLGAVGDKLCVMQGVVPSLVSGSGKQYLVQVERFAAYTPDGKDQVNGRPHTSDMCILERQAIASPESADTFCRFNYVTMFGDEGWQTAPVVHYANSAMTPRNMTPRWKHIPGLRP